MPRPFTGGTGRDRERCRSRLRYLDPAASDATGNGSVGLPWRTLDRVIATAPVGAVVALPRAGVYAVTRGNLPVGVTLTAAGAGYKPVIDARQSLAGAVWTLNSGAIWTTTVTFRDATTAGGVNATNTTYFALADCTADPIGTLLRWQVGAASIAANIAAMTAGSWTVHRTGSSQQDPRTSGESSTNFTVYVWLADSSNPNGKDLRIADQGGVLNVAGNALTNVRLVGAWGKDSVGTTDNLTGPDNQFTDCEHWHYGCHAYVGRGQFTRWAATGYARPGMTSGGSAISVTPGGAPDLYAAAYRDVVLTLTDLTVSNTLLPVYGHGTGTNQGWRQVVLTGTLTITTTGGTAVRFDRLTSRAAFVANGVDASACQVIATGLNTGFVVDGPGWVVGTDSAQSSLAFQNSPTNARNSLVNLDGSAAGFKLVNCAISSAYANGSQFTSAGNLLYGRGSASGDPVPTLELSNVVDSQAVSGGTYANRFTMPRTADPARLVNLVLSNGTQLGDLHRATTDAIWPASLTVGAGCRFGFGGRTGPQIVAALNAAGITNSISNQTTIVGLTGQTLSSPGW